MDKDNLAKALGKIPSGLFVVTAKDNENMLGFTASFVSQVAFEPPIVSVSINKKNSKFSLIEKTNNFTINIMSKDNMKLVGHFAKPRDEEFDYFNEINYEINSFGNPILKDTIGYLNCEIMSKTDAGDHFVILAKVNDGKIINEGEPATHIRKNGFNY